MQYPGKLLNQTSENGKKPNFGQDFGPFDPNLDSIFFVWILPLLLARHCSQLQLYTI